MLLNPSKRNSLLEGYFQQRNSSGKRAFSKRNTSQLEVLFICLSYLPAREASPLLKSRGLPCEQFPQDLTCPHDCLLAIIFGSFLEIHA